MDSPAKLLLTEREAARVLSLSVRTLFNLRAAGSLPYLRVGTAVRYDADDLRRWIAAQRQGGRIDG